MGSRDLAVIHCFRSIPWQPQRADYFVQGLTARGIKCVVTDSPTRRHDLGGFPILLGTSRWKAIEQDGGEFLLVDRCSFGDTNRFVSLVWNGRGRRGDHRIPEHYGAERWERYGVPLKPWQPIGKRIVLCGQTDTAFSPHWKRPEDWYKAVAATDFRPHPSTHGVNPTRLPVSWSFEDAIAVTLNSSVGVRCVLDGVPAITMDEAAMAWDVTGHRFDDIRMPDRRDWCAWLAWTQYSDDEIREGKLWDWLL